MKKDNKTTALNIAAIAVGMFGMAYAAVPLYDLFCKITGFGGTVKQVNDAPSEILDRKINVMFNSDTSKELQWSFKPSQTKLEVNIGESGLAFYEAVNNSDKTVIGTATYNVTPIKAAKYFNKVECFCFEKQILDPNEKMQFPVSFFVDPEIINDKNLDEVKTVTLSYTFFPYKGSIDRKSAMVDSNLINE